MPDNHAVENKTTWRPRLGETDRLEKQSLNAVEEGNCVIGEEEQVWTPTRKTPCAFVIKNLRFVK